MAKFPEAVFNGFSHISEGSGVGGGVRWTDAVQYILEWGGGAPSRAENSQREGGPAWEVLSLFVRSSVRSFVRHTQNGPKRASKSLKFH